MTSRPKKKWLLYVMMTALLISIGFYLRRARVPQQPSATASAFRHYLADRNARMVVYSFDSELQNGTQRQTVHEQLTMLRQKFDGLVLYSCDSNAIAILKEARSLGYRAVLLTVWDPKSKREIDTAAELVRSYRDFMALAVSIGSEGLMDERYDFRDLDSARDRLQRQLTIEKVEVTTSEPWWLYTRDNADADALAAFGDFVTAHIHVIWDTDISDPAAAAEWTAGRARELRRPAQGRPILIREAGFPGGGNSPRKSLSLAFTRDAQATFWVSLLHRESLEATPPTWVAFEGVDNRAKQWHDFEPTWGLITSDLQPHQAWNSFPPL